ncbi:MAG: hypothetical protein J3Q66DRAFT_57508 [Benniella sp.]|nr:MAG: hypothetical protein J3Q66DRAFT_57508 [Benniella sp.]
MNGDKGTKDNGRVRTSFSVELWLHGCMVAWDGEEQMTGDRDGYDIGIDANTALPFPFFPFLPFSSHFPPANHYHFHAPHPIPPPSFFFFFFPSSVPSAAVIPYIGKKVSTGDRIVATEHADSLDRPAHKQNRNQSDRSILLLITFFLLLLHLHRPSHTHSLSIVSCP